jgi:phosphoglycolate phosphatase-like HAD superfamily hydrolase
VGRVAGVKAVAVDLDALGDTRPLWRDFLVDAARRFAAIAPLEPEALADDRAAAAVELDRWAEAGVGDWRGALHRFAEDRAPVYLRPNAEASAALRALGDAGVRVGVHSDAPEALAGVALAQLGAARYVEAVETGDGALERLVARLGGDVETATTLAELTKISIDAS